MTPTLLYDSHSTSSTVAEDQLGIPPSINAYGLIDARTLSDISQLMFTHSVYLVGMTGSGKTTIGKELAIKLGYPFFDSDREIETKVNLKISEIFEYQGEQSFRKQETETIEELTKLRKVVVATGGGSILRMVTRKNLSRRGFVIYLNAPIQVLVDRTQKNQSRPLLQGRDTFDVLEEMYEQRNALYSEVADVTFDTYLYENINEATQAIAQWYNQQI